MQKVIYKLDNSMDVGGSKIENVPDDLRQYIKAVFGEPNREGYPDEEKGYDEQWGEYAICFADGTLASIYSRFRQPRIGGSNPKAAQLVIEALNNARNGQKPATLMPLDINGYANIRLKQFMCIGSKLLLEISHAESTQTKLNSQILRQIMLEMADATGVKHYG